METKAHIQINDVGSMHISVRMFACVKIPTHIVVVVRVHKSKCSEIFAGHLCKAVKLSGLCWSLKTSLRHRVIL